MALLVQPVITILDDNGNPVSGGIAEFYISGGSTPATVYADSELATPLGSTVEADSAGRLPTIYIDPTTTYRMVQKEADGTVIRDIETYDVGGGGGGGGGGSTLPVEDLAALKATPLSEKIKSLSDSLFIAKEGDYSQAPLGPPDDEFVVEADDTDASEGAWVRQDAVQAARQYAKSYFQAYISGTTLTVVGTPLLGDVQVGAVLSSPSVSVAAGTTILEQLTGTANGAGTYRVSISQTAGQADPAVYFNAEWRLPWRRPIEVKSAERKTIFDYQFDGTDSFADILEQACKYVPWSSELIIPTPLLGTYLLDRPIEIKRQIKLFHEGGGIGVTFAAGDAAKYAITINVEDALNLDNRGFEVRSLRMYANNDNMKGLIRVKQDAPNLANHIFLFDKCNLAGPDTGGPVGFNSDYAIRVDGVGTLKAIIQSSTIFGGIGDFTSDGFTLRDCNYGGLNTFLFMYKTPGAFASLVANNIGQTRDGFAYIAGGSQITFRENQIEHYIPESGSLDNPNNFNQSTYKSQVTLEGGPEGVIRNIRFIDNNFGGGLFVEAALHNQVYTEDIFIEGNNVFYPGSSGYDIRQADASCRTLHVAPTTRWRGGRTGIGYTGSVDPYQAPITGSISGTTLTITAIGANRNVSVGDDIYASSGVARVASFGSGTGGTGTYNLATAPGNVGSSGMTLFSNTGTVFDENGRDVRRMQSMADNGVGSVGVLKIVSLSNSWTASTDYMHWKEPNGDLKFDGTWTAGTVTAATKITTLPLGFRVTTETERPVWDKQNNAWARLKFKVDGDVEVAAATAGAVLVLDTISLNLPVSIDYRPGI